MLMSATTRTVNPIIMSRAIADAVLSELRASGGQRAERLAVLSILRLLRMYETDQFRLSRSVGILKRDDSADLNSRRPARQYDQLRDALQSAHDRFSRGSSKTQFVESVRNLFAHFAVDGTSGYTDADRIEKAERFLSVLSESLEEV